MMREELGDEDEKRFSGLWLMERVKERTFLDWCDEKRRWQAEYRKGK
jgi:hypothetical protein